MKTIETRKDIELLVESFYTKVRAHNELGPIFSRHIKEDEWPEHLSKLSDFWETNLFGVRKFKGNPTQKHINVDQAHPGGLEQELFGYWLQLWIATLDELFHGKLAEKAKDAARNIAHIQFLILWKKKNTQTINNLV
ncbi:group III truncated hemoglobin [Lishizhenia sp.]|uniref:group III truncated hemoglobin n=1 Tax=Lishizhenia sp. TaxID=2497594 RepID=UPI00299F4FFF|nr:group III truncated hemoglobin [Lishizhenia sp.]MDX1447234.1 group III truncated hemoglobin [Lishizhenia sp.]